MEAISPRITERISYLRRLLNIYIRFDKRYSHFDISVENNTGKTCYVKVEFYKSVEVEDADGVVRRYENVKSGTFTIARLSRLINVYRTTVSKLFKNRRNMVSYDELV